MGVLRERSRPNIYIGYTTDLRSVSLLNLGRADLRKCIHCSYAILPLNSLLRLFYARNQLLRGQIWAVLRKLMSNCKFCPTVSEFRGRCCLGCCLTAWPAFLHRPRPAVSSIELRQAGNPQHSIPAQSHRFGLMDYETPLL